MTRKKLPLIFAATTLAFLTACDGTAPNGNQNAQQGALIGAGIGALTGILNNRDGDRGNRLEGAFQGAIIGAAGGAAVGNSLDKQEAELRGSLGSGVGIVNNGDSLIVTLPQDILFATNSTAVSGASQRDLSTLARSINDYPNTSVNVVGHTDNVGNASFNYDLSQRRAQAVSSVLINAGVSAARIRSIGRGEDAPVATNLTAEGRQQNRRRKAEHWRYSPDRGFDPARALATG